ncbi:MAG TPA: hypothetical protein VMS88_03565, partial [Terriglobales bacterium]|nr:hypothetical protein [Terriglobales bacterium]
FGSATIVTGAPRRAPAVPDSSIVEDDLTGQRRVALIDRANRLRWEPVALGQAEGGWHELLSPRLAAGTRVAVEGQLGLPAGTRVQPRP